MLYIIFGKMDDGLDRMLNDARRRPWTAPKEAQPGDTALFYFGGVNPGIQAIGRTATSAQAGVPGDWTESERGFFARHADVEKLRQPVPLQQIRKQFPAWGRWKNLRGVRVHKVPANLRERVAAVVANGNPSARTLLSSWLRADEPESSHRVSPDRPLVSVRRRLRNSRFGKLVCARSGGQCGACSAATDYDKMGILEAAHIRSVEKQGPDDLSNALALCPNHHALFDEGKWTLNGKRIVFGQSLPEEIRKTFARQIRCNWHLDESELKWHRQKVFKRKARDG